MPKIREPEPPEIDLLKAVMLERKDTLGYTFEDIAKRCGFHPASIRRLFTKSPWEWPRETRLKMCRCLKIPSKYYQEGMEP